MSDWIAKPLRLQASNGAHRAPRLAVGYDGALLSAPTEPTTGPTSANGDQQRQLTVRVRDNRPVRHGAIASRFVKTPV